MGARRECKVIDSWVGRFPQAVTCFSPGSYVNRPRQAVAGSNVVVAGDWVKGVDHGANGLSQVKMTPRSRETLEKTAVRSESSRR